MIIMIRIIRLILHPQRVPEHKHTLLLFSPVVRVRNTHVHMYVHVPHTVIHGRNKE